MSDDFFTNKKIVSDFKAKREQDIKDQSKERLKKIACKKIETTMIGSISSIEKHLSHLWKDSPQLKEAFDDLRAEILRRGNNQIRNLQIELGYYDVVWNRYETIIPVINTKGEK